MANHSRNLCIFKRRLSLSSLWHVFDMAAYSTEQLHHRPGSGGVWKSIPFYVPSTNHTANFDPPYRLLQPERYQNTDQATVS